MTFVGKVLVIVQVVLSLCFMAFAGAVYTVQEDWKTAYEKKVAELQTKDTLVQEQDEQISFLNKNLAASGAIQENIQTYLDGIDQFLASQTGDDKIKTQLRLLATRAQRAEQDKSTLEAEVAKKDLLLMTSKENYEKLETANKKVVDEAKERAQEATVFKQINQDLNGKVTALQNEVFDLSNQLFTLETDFKTAAVKQTSLLGRVAFLQDVIRKEGIDEEEALAKTEPPPVVSGRVINMTPASRKGPEFVEINLGSDDGLDEDHVLQVYSLQGRGQYLGKIKLVKVTHDRAVGEVILKTKNGIIRKDDNVTTKHKI